MQAVILAAGKSTRTYPLTITRPKPLLKIAGKTILEHNLNALHGLVDEVILIVGFKKQMIIDFLGNEYNGIKIKYVEQTEQLGTGHALLQAKTCLTDKFILLNGDDIYSRKDIEKCLKHKYCVMVKKVNDPEKWGIVKVENNKVVKIIEKPKEFVGDLCNIQFFVLDIKIFEHQLQRSPRGEYEATDYITYLASVDHVNYEEVSDYWLPVGYPWHILNSNEFLMKKLSLSEAKGTLEQGVTVKGVLILGKNSVIMTGAYIQGPVIIGDDCVIGPRAFIRGHTFIGNNCKINAEVKNCVIYDNTNIAHSNSYIGDSVIGYNVNLGSGTTTANLRHDNANVKSFVKDKLVDTGRRKLGTIIGDNVHTGIFTQIYPGRKIWPNKTTLPNEVVRKDLV